MATARFRKFVGNDQQFYFSLIAPNNEIILQSEGYKSRANRDNGIQSVRTNATNPGNFHIKDTKNGRWHFTLNSAHNGQVIGQSQVYSSKPAAEQGIAAVMKDAPIAVEVDG